jgi:hypothetical protein
MSVHQLGDGRWIVKFPKGKIPDAPNKTREYFGRGKEAEQLARLRNTELGLGNKSNESRAREELKYRQLLKNVSAAATVAPALNGLSCKFRQIRLRLACFYSPKERFGMSHCFIRKNLEKRCF